MAHRSSAPLRGTIERTYAGVVVRTSCLLANLLGIRGRSSHFILSGPKLLGLPLPAVCGNNRSQSHGPHVRAVLQVVNCNRGVKAKFTAVIGA